MPQVTKVQLILAMQRHLRLHPSGTDDDVMTALGLYHPFDRELIKVARQNLQADGVSLRPCEPEAAPEASSSSRAETPPAAPEPAPDSEPRKVPVVLQPGQKLVDGTGRKCTGCGRQFADGEQALFTRAAWPPSYNSAARLECAACYRPPGRNERFTDDGRSTGSLTSWSSGGYA